ncbi:hypothetical protein R1X32_10935 (plasmid) [Rhodococcus opacus]|uniref:hypothetical protein n=1 Tax=Rhodococcus TaxID=1827 RepID=UPI0012E86C4D|nr:hypothetical protein [Rhodococcus oxybenzonivorans]
MADRQAAVGETAEKSENMGIAQPYYGAARVVLGREAIEYRFQAGVNITGSVGEQF